MPQITSPAAGSSNPISGTSGSVTVEWKDDGEAPKISELKSFTLQLIVGGNTDTDSVSDACKSREGECRVGGTRVSEKNLAVSWCRMRC